MEQPYIGVTGFSNRYDVIKAIWKFNKIQKYFKKSGFIDKKLINRKLMVGVLVNSETLGREHQNINLYPDINVIQGIFHPDSVMNIIHYYTNSKKFFVELMLLHEIAGPDLNGFQLNLVWPNLQELSAYKKRYSISKITLQISEESLKEVRWGPCRNNEFFKYELKKYSNLVDYILLDQSRGKGILFSEKEALIQLQIVRDALPDVGLVIAGGLGPNTVHFIKNILKEFPDVSFDATTNLTNENGKLDLEKVSQYFDESFKMISSTEISE